jgi:putative hydrolase of the HAD superfamily
MLNWSTIDTVLLDMDGTLLDLHYDNQFWLEYLPAQYAKKQNISLAQAKHKTSQMYQQVHGTLQWYCLDYWQQQLGLNILELKQQLSHLIQVRPYVTEFLVALRQADKRVILLTNAFPTSLTLKMELTQLGHHFDLLLSTHQLGYAKESNLLWQAIYDQHDIAPATTLFVDDSEKLLTVATDNGVGQCLGINQPDSQQSAIEMVNFPSISHFNQIIDEIT